MRDWSELLPGMCLGLAFFLGSLVGACVCAWKDSRPPSQEQSCVKICSPGDPLRIVVVPEHGVCAARIQM